MAIDAPNFGTGLASPGDAAALSGQSDAAIPVLDSGLDIPTGTAETPDVVGGGEQRIDLLQDFDARGTLGYFLSPRDLTDDNQLDNNQLVLPDHTGVTVGCDIDNPRPFGDSINSNGPGNNWLNKSLRLQDGVGSPFPCQAVMAQTSTGTKMFSGIVVCQTLDLTIPPAQQAQLFNLKGTGSSGSPAVFGLTGQHVGYGRNTIPRSDDAATLLVDHTILPLTVGTWFAIAWRHMGTPAAFDNAVHIYVSTVAGEWVDIGSSTAGENAVAWRGIGFYANEFGPTAVAFAAGWEERLSVADLQAAFETMQVAEGLI